MKERLFADIIVPNAFTKNHTFTYEVSSKMIPDIHEGMLIETKLQNRKVRGIVFRLHNNQPSYALKPVENILHKESLLKKWQLQLIQEISDYYFASYASVCKLFIPNKIWEGNLQLPVSTWVEVKNPFKKDFSRLKRDKELAPEIIRQLEFGAMEKKTLMQHFDLKNDRILKKLAEAEWITFYESENIPKKSHYEMTEGFLKNLNGEQDEVVSSICKDSQGNEPVLLHGITGSGKTEVYLHTIYHYVKQGKQAILLVPEIALTPQMHQYFTRVFGEELAILHSKLTASEKKNEWIKIYKNHAKVIVGSRSALFAPVQDLGVIIIDEEHEWTYKQENTPSYHARKVSEMMSKKTGCKVILGSATPDIESFYKAKTNEYLLNRLTQRTIVKEEESSMLPEVSIVDLREEFHKKNKSVISIALQNKIRACLEKKEQVILFLNKRGAHSAVVCRDCGYVCKCDVCEVSLTHHKSKNFPAGRLVCHHCGLLKDPPTLCDNCKSAHIRYIGAGTQQVEGELKTLFPEANILRADRDTTGKKDDYQALYDGVSKGKYDIVIGTQMITKGFDFPNVTLVGVILAETTLYIPDFRSSERLFQLMLQVAGRAGRGHRKGEVIVQTYNPENPIFQYIKTHDYEGFHEKEIADREDLSFPPFNAIIKLRLSHIDKKIAFTAVKEFKKLLDETIQASAFNVQAYMAPALIPRLHGKYHFHIILKGSECRELLKKVKVPKEFRVDVDPVQVC